MAKATKHATTIIGDFDGGNITIKFGRSHAKTPRYVQGASHLHIRILYDEKIAHEFLMPPENEQVVLPLPSVGLPENVEVFDVRSNVSLYRKSISLENLYKFVISSMVGNGLRFSIELTSNLNLKMLSVELRLSDETIFAFGRLEQIKVEGTTFHYRGSLDLACLIRIGPSQLVRLFVFQRPTDCCSYVSANNVGVVGYVDISQSSAVAGWIGSFSESVPYSVTLWINGTAAATMIADNPRPDVSAIGIASQNCGFSFMEKAIGAIPIGSSVTVSVGQAPSLHLLNCPLEIAD